MFFGEGAGTMRTLVVLLMIHDGIATRSHHHHHSEEQSPQETATTTTTTTSSTEEETPPQQQPHHRESGVLASIYENYDEAPLFDHWMEYAQHYERHLPRPCMHRRRQQTPEPYHATNSANPILMNCEPVNMLEIGVQSGGSTRIWKRYYGDQLRYVGVDINPKCKRSESLEEHIVVEIGSQLDPAFLEKVCNDHGPFDVVIDDGGHTFDMINATLHAIFPSDKCMRPHGVYAVEDLHSMAMCDYKIAGHSNCKSPHEFRDLLGELYFSMLYYWDSNAHSHENHHKKPHPVWGTKIIGIHLYDSLMFLLRGENLPNTRFHRGYDKIPYQ